MSSSPAGLGRSLHLSIRAPLCMVLACHSCPGSRGGMSRQACGRGAPQSVSDCGLLYVEVLRQRKKHLRRAGDQDMHDALQCIRLVRQSRTGHSQVLGLW
jgi:hypothetical protein